MRADSAASTAWVIVTSLRRSTASATVPPMIGNTKTGINAARPQQPDRERRSRDREDLERDRHGRELVPEPRDAVTEEQEPGVARCLERRQIHEVAAGTSQEAGPRRRVWTRRLGVGSTTAGP